MAYPLADIDLDIICGAIDWVIRHSQMANGAFKEIGKVIHGEMMVCTLSYKTILAVDEVKSIVGV